MPEAASMDFSNLSDTAQYEITVKRALDLGGGLIARPTSHSIKLKGRVIKALSPTNQESIATVVPVSD